ncbi:MAG TPA: LPS-assembly protein LptD [Gammaproteobacteria bacterium]|jgi:LPS-assembly protein|nr:LPS-assembly protein LptD [Gammaproteobacteria bacterium]
MYLKKKLLTFFVAALLLPLIALSATTPTDNIAPPLSPLTQEMIAKQLGWVPSTAYLCGGYYVEPPFFYPAGEENNKLVEITGNQGLLSQNSTTTLEGKVTLNRYGQQITANKAYLYRDPITGKLSMIDLIGNVHLREPNTLVIAEKGRYIFRSQAKILTNNAYRMTMQGLQISGPNISATEMQTERHITALTAWGGAKEFSQTQPKVYELTQATFSTCTPINPAWTVKAKHIELDKNTGRGYATHARVYIKEVPVLYTPYISFPLDKRRKSGFLWPIIGGDSLSGPSLYAPFYWNIAPNYDMTITPAILTKRGIQLSDEFRYLTMTSRGDLNVSVLPNDKAFRDFQTAEKKHYAGNTNPAIQAELSRLENASITRSSVSWRNRSQFNPHWSSHVDFNYVSDDYYLRDFSTSLNEITQNQLLQEADITYKGQNWNFIGRVQQYQTLHQLDEEIVDNQPRRLPQIVLNGIYPDQPYGLEYFINNEATHFEMQKTPGTTINEPVGNRFNTQPGINLPLYWPYFYINPRAQIALTNYSLHQTTDTLTPKTINRAVPIFDVASGFSLSRDVRFANFSFMQTLEPQVYYTYIPYRNQKNIPVFDTTVNTLTYDQIFNYNRFTGIDRIGDANQIGVGITTRLIDQHSGLEKVRLGVGEIIYFTDRRVTLCNTPAECTDNPLNPENHYRLSPLSGVLDYHVSDIWKVRVDSIWNPISRGLDNSTVTLSYKTDEMHILNLSYSFVRNGDPFSGLEVNSSDNNLKSTDFSFFWPITHKVSAVGRWTQDWNTNHLQNLLFGLQYDTCCWAVRAVAGKTFTNIINNTPQYNSEFYIQFALKGLGNIGSGNPSSLLSAITGYNPTLFG